MRTVTGKYQLGETTQMWTQIEAPLFMTASRKTFVTARAERVAVVAINYILSNDGCNSFYKHLNLAMAPNKTHEGVKKQ